jgi:hypothetical protein
MLPQVGLDRTAKLVGVFKFAERRQAQFTKLRKLL